MARLIGDACKACLTSPERGEEWLVVARKVRTDPKLAQMVYDKLSETLSGEDLIHARRELCQRYGFAPPVVCEPTVKAPKLRLVKS